MSNQPSDENYPRDEYIPSRRSADPPDGSSGDLPIDPSPSPSVTSRRRRPPWQTPLILYVLTWLSTSLVNVLPTLIWCVLVLLLEDFRMKPVALASMISIVSSDGMHEALFWGMKYSVAIMTILTCHEAGYYIQARRYGVRSSLPYFIPMPLPPFGTMGAVIRMDSHIPNRRALFDIGISGPLAGLVPAILCIILGLHWSDIMPVQPGGTQIGEPLLFQWIANLYYGPITPGMDIYIHPVGFAGLVGLFITSLNLMPISQLDGGHVSYAILGRRAHIVAMTLLLAITTVVIFREQYHWLLMVAILYMMGPKHPPTRDDRLPINRPRQILGWLTLSFILIGFTPEPIDFGETESAETIEAGEVVEATDSQQQEPEQLPGVNEQQAE